MPGFANKNIGDTVKCEFPIKTIFFSISMPQRDSLKIFILKNIFVVYLELKFN